tara:strand:+ start:1258 stop:2079 length:822 start_codon:yes stop_codon:yes gene_type:complete
MARSKQTKKKDNPRKRKEKKNSRSIPRQKRKLRPSQKKTKKKKSRSRKKKPKVRAGTGLIPASVTSLVGPYVSGNTTSIGVLGDQSMVKNKFFKKADVDIPVAKNPLEYLSEQGAEYWKKYSKDLRGAKKNSETGDKLVAILSPNDPRSLKQSPDKFFAAIDLSGQTISKDNLVSKFSSGVFKVSRKYIRNLLSGKDIKSMKKDNPLIPPNKKDFKVRNFTEWMMDSLADDREPELWIVKVGGDKNKDTIPDISVWMPHGGPGGRGEFETIVF